MMSITEKCRRVLYFDIEKTFSTAAVWRTGKQYVNYDQILEPSKIICIAYKWSDSHKVECLTWDKNQDDTKMLKEFNKIAEEADVLCGHNAENYDVKEIRTAIALRGLADAWCETPVIDTLKEYRKVFKFDSNRLDSLGKMLKLGRKNPMTFDDWIKVVQGDKKALNKMVKYCKQDVRLVESIDKRLNEYVVPRGNSMLLTRMYKPATCSNCEGGNLIKYGTYSYKEKKLQKYLCKDCFKVSK